MTIRKQDLIKVIEAALRDAYPGAEITSGDLGVTIFERSNQSNGWTIAPRKSDAVLRSAVRVAKRWPPK
ncbi:hypothetical protein GR212_15240 [Rhizobium lusitanum]|uniref:Uncharacterized protein n=1 Tax=Rhizobium lusitanum TaxID=293958 RepID=A0A6L9UA04_9HYPH|nr:hypothetical protein [Rhizobium lusitanum]NEI70937.1 hypothetical protein [Rhizobium lusitanum]